MRLLRASAACCLLLFWVPSSAARIHSGAGYAPGPADVVHVLGVAVLVLVGHRWIRHRRQLAGLVRVVRALGDGVMSCRAPARGPRPVEVPRLADAFHEMAEVVRVCGEKQAALLVDVSHQLRNPLTVLSLRMEMLSLSVAGEAREEVEMIREEMNRLDTMLGRILELASARTSLTARTGPTAALDLVTGRVAAWRPQAESRSLTIEVAAASSAVLRVDATLAGSILDTLLDNAIKFSPQGGRITVRLRDDALWTTVGVADEGPGLAPDDFDRIGDRFWRGATTKEEPGTGLGLSIAREMAAVVGGQLTFTAVEPHGLCVGLRLPRADSGPAVCSGSRSSGRPRPD